MDIKSGTGYPASSLSNFAPHKFIIDGVGCNSMEGFLQSLKFKNSEMQKEICKLVGVSAKRAGAKKDWKKDQILYWLGNSIKRDSNEYQNLLDRAYLELSKNEKFRKALISTGDSALTHSIGKRKKNETVLTVNEFCGRLVKIREQIKKENKENE